MPLHWKMRQAMMMRTMIADVIMTAVVNVPGLDVEVTQLWRTERLRIPGPGVRAEKIGDIRIRKNGGINSRTQST